MEWVETTAKSVDEARNLALDQLGVADDEAEFEVLEEPKAGLFGRVRGEARVRARIRPAAVRPKQDRRGRSSKSGGNSRGGQGRGKSGGNGNKKQAAGSSPGGGRGKGEQRARSESNKPRSSQKSEQRQGQETSVDQESTVTPQEVGDAAVAFMSGLADALGADSSTTIEVDGTELDVRVDGDELGLLIGPGGRTLAAVQDLARVASQRRLGDHDTRLRVDVAGYRERRRVALEKFALAVADEVVSAGEPKALEPMLSADRKIVHDALVDVEGVSSHSEGDDPTRRVVITPD